MSCSFTSTEQSEVDLLKCVSCSNTLEDPVILTCLHSVCKSCSCQVTDFTCTVCKVTTDTTVAKCNIIVSGLVHRAEILKRVYSCTACTDDGKIDEASVIWCQSCQMALCADCAKSHKRLNKGHEVKPIHESTNLSEICRTPLRFCASHGEEITLTCFTCQEGRCRKCAHGCYTSCHSVELLDDPAGVARTADIRSKVASLLSCLNSTNVQLDTHLGLPDAVAIAREKSISTLKNEKKAAIDSISKAYENAESSLLECWDTLASKAVLLRASAENLKARLDWTNQYCQVALKTDDIAGLLPQLGSICSSLCSLLEQAKQVKEPMEPLKLVKMDVRSPHEMDLIAAELLSLPRLVSDDFCNPQSSILSEGESTYNAREAPSKPLRFEDTPRGTFKGPGCCWDVAVTAQGRLLVAAADDGLKEYDVTDFREITTWTPPADLIGDECAFVRTVCALDDGRAIVGLSPNLVVLLRRDDQSGVEWVIEKCSKGINEIDDSDADSGGDDDRDSGNDRLHGNHIVSGSRGGDIDGRSDMGSNYGKDRVGNKDSTNGDSCKGNHAGDRKTLSSGGCEKESCNRIVKSAEGGGFDDVRNGRRSGSDSDDEECSNYDTSSNTGIGRWQLRELCVIELRTPPGQLSAWGDRLLAALETRYDDSTDSWCCGPGLVLVSLSNGEELVRLQLDYDCESVALTDSMVAVTSVETVKLAEKGCGELDSAESRVVDCYSHAGIRLWRHVVGVDVAVISLCSDAVARVLYAAANSCVVTLSVDSGRVLSTALTLSKQDTEMTYAIALDRSTRRFLAVISFDGEEPNTVTLHFAL